MVIDFGNNVVIFQTWPEFKAICQSKSLQMQYADDADVYIPFGIDTGIVYRTTLFKGTVPAVADWDQSTNDTWKTDFVNNFLPTANARIKDAVDTTGTATVTGSVNTDMRISGVAVSNSNPVPMSDSGGSLTVDGSVSVSNFPATQPISAVSLPLPTGAATESTLSAISGKLPATLGQKTNGNSLAVTIASDQTAVPVSDGGGSITVDGSVSISSLPLPTGAATSALQTTGNSSLSSIDTKLPASLVGGRLDNNIGSWLGSTAPSVGQKTAAASIPVTLASDQSAISVSMAAPPNTTPTLTFGDISLTDPLTDIAIRRTTYTEQTSNFTGSIVSSSAADTAAGTGARTVKIFYVDSTGATAGTETVTLNGTTPVNLAVSTKCYIEKMVVLTVGSGGKNAGTITLKTGSAGAGTTVGTIAVGDNRTFWCHHYIVTGKTANITGILHSNTSTVSGNTSYVVLKSKSLSNAAAAEIQESDFIDVAGAANPFNRNYISTIQVQGPARVILYVSCISAATITYRGSFDSYE